MEILEFAMKMELDGKAFYDKQARQFKDKDLKKIFNLLAEEEERHYKFFKNMKDGKNDQALKNLSSSNKSLSTIKNIFVEMSENNENKSFGDDEVATWKKALEIEEKAESFYRQKANEESDTEKKKLLNLIADEEQDHIHMIAGVLSYLKFPDAFAESEQFKNFQSLEGH